MEAMQKMAVIIITILLGLLLIFQIAHAEIYKWVDEKGTVHFTEDPSTIPEKYQDKIKSRQTEEDKMTPEEKVKAKEEYERERKKRLEKERLEYEQSVKEEERRRNIRRAEDAAEERQIRAEKEEKEQRAKESKEEPGPEYAKDPCPYCGGSGIIWKKTRVLKKNGYFGPARWEEEKIATKCEQCNGKGFTMRRVK